MEQRDKKACRQATWSSGRYTCDCATGILLSWELRYRDWWGREVRKGLHVGSLEGMGRGQERLQLVCSCSTCDRPKLLFLLAEQRETLKVFWLKCNYIISLFSCLSLAPMYCLVSPSKTDGLLLLNYFCFMTSTNKHKNSACWIWLLFSAWTFPAMIMVSGITSQGAHLWGSIVLLPALFNCIQLFI